MEVLMMWRKQSVMSYVVISDYKHNRTYKVEYACYAENESKRARVI